MTVLALSPDTLEETFGDLAKACISSIVDGGGIGWVKPPSETELITYFRSVASDSSVYLLAKLNRDEVFGSIQLELSKSDVTKHRGTIKKFFVSPKARGKGVGGELMTATIMAARNFGLTALYLDVRETQKAAIRLYKSFGFVSWTGETPVLQYAYVDGVMHGGFYMSLDLTQNIYGQE